MVAIGILEEAVPAPPRHSPYTAGIKGGRQAIIDAPVESLRPALSGVRARYNHMGPAVTFDVGQIEEQFDEFITIDVVVKSEVSQIKRLGVTCRRIRPK